MILLVVGLQKDLRIKVKADFGATRCRLETCNNEPIEGAEEPAPGPFGDNGENSSEESDNDSSEAEAPEPAAEGDFQSSKGCIVTILEYEGTGAVETGIETVNAEPTVGI